jgi:GT2 family glycosyltransferase
VSAAPDAVPGAARVAAIVVAWQSAADLPACLGSLEDQDHDALEVVVVDNASTDGTAAVLATAATSPRRHPLQVRTNATNRGFAGGVNDALALLGPEVDVVLLVNPDTRLAPDLVRRGVAALLADPRRGSVQPKVRRAVPAPDGRPVLDTTGHVLTRARLLRNRGEGAIDDGRHDVAGPVFGVSGAVALHRRAMLADVTWRGRDAVGQVLTEDLFAYFDDVELDWRARLLGWSAWYEPAAVAWHVRGGAGPRRTATVEALNWSNRLLVLATCDDRRALVRVAPLVGVTTLLKTAELALTCPRALLPALRRLRLLPAARRRRRELVGRARVSPAQVVARWCEPFSWGDWVGTWWRRVTGRALGVAGR